MTIFQLVAGGFGLLAVAGAGTMALPQKVHVERQAHIDSTVERVIELAASNRGYQRFNPYRTADPDLDIRHFGPEHGVGSGFHFKGRDGNGSQVVSEITENTVRYAIDLGALGKPEQTLRVEPADDGVLVTWSMDADLGMNPVARVFGLFMDGMIGDTLEVGLINLEAAS